MTRQGSISVLAICNSLEETKNLIASVRLGAHHNLPIIILAPDFIVRSSSLLGTGWEGVSLLPKKTKLKDLAELDTDYVLAVPSANTVSITGIYAAAALLDKNIELTEVGGLGLDLGGSVESGAFRQVYQDVKMNVVMAPLEICSPLWMKSGAFAFTSADSLGGFTMVRRHRLGERHLFNGSVEARALACLGSENYKAMVYSGLVITTVSGFTPASKEDGEVEEAPQDTHALWENSTRSEVRILHRGYGLRNDDVLRVFFFSDRNIRAVDGNPIRLSPDSGDYYQLRATLTQLGFGSDVALGKLPNGQESPGERTRTQNSLAEDDLIRFVRKFTKLFPKRALDASLRTIRKFI